MITSLQSMGISMGLILSWSVFVFLNNKNRTYQDFIVYSIFSLYISLVISITLFPIDFASSDIYKGPDVILNPLNSWMIILNEGSYIPLKQLGGNILMFVPLGVFLPMINKKFRRGEIVFFTAMFFSIGIEYIQFIESSIFPAVGRTTEVNDVILNTLGAVVGYNVYQYCRNNELFVEQ